MKTQFGFVKVHAAEYLLWTGHPKGVKTTFMKVNQRFGTVKPYRIGIWRVLAQADNSVKMKKLWSGKIMNVFTDTDAVDRINAAEALAKLGISPLTKYPKLTKQAISSSDTSLSLYTLWAASFSGRKALTQCKKKSLNIIRSKQATPLERLRAAYILRHIDGLDVNEWEMLATHALSDKTGSMSKAYFLSAAYVIAPDGSIQSHTYNQIKKELLMERNSHRVGNRTEMAAVLIEKGGKDDLPVLISMLNNKNPLPSEADNADISAVAAYAILRIGEKNDSLNSSL